MSKNIGKRLWLKLKSHPVMVMMVSFSVLLFICSSWRHELFQSTAWDLGIFDQALYLISQNQTPISSFMGFHLLGDHAAFIFYPLALLYKIYPTVYWLFGLQAIALALGALPTYHLAITAGLKKSQAVAMAAVYLLYPLIFNINLFDFHPDVIALPAFLWAILTARLGQVRWFCIAIVLILSCKAVLSLTVAAMGIWLLVFENRRIYGAIALFFGVAWFILATQEIIPFFGGESATVARHISRYQHLGSSFSEISKNLLSQPQLFIFTLFSLENLGYMVLLLAPILWGISPANLTPLVGAFPALSMNFLANSEGQKDLIHQYSLPILPFLILAVISSLAAGKGWLQNWRGIILWSLVAFLALAKIGYFGSRYLEPLDTWQATREALALVSTKGSVLTTSYIAPHLSQRALIKLTNAAAPPANLGEFDYVLLNMRHPGLDSNHDFAVSLVNQLKKNLKFQVLYQKNEVFLFSRIIN